MNIEVVYVGHKETKKGDRYTITEEIQMKHPETREWVNAYIYHGQGTPDVKYCREEKDFWKHFKIEDPVWDVKIEAGEGWSHLLDDIKFFIALYNEKNKMCGDPIRILQAKEKFGELRIYVNYFTPTLSRLIEEAQREASRTCEDCGSKVNVGTKSGGWISTMCEQCVVSTAIKQEKPQYWYSEGKKYIVNVDGTKTIVDNFGEVKSHENI